MPIEWRVNDNGTWVDVTFSDPYSIAESERVMKEIFATAGLPRPLRFLVDVRRSSPPSTEFVVSAITFWQLHVSDMWGAKIAVVTSDAAQMAKAQLSEDSAQARELPFTIRDFGEAGWNDARAWLSA